MKSCRGFVAWAVVGLLLSPYAFGQNISGGAAARYPNKPIRLVVPQPPGGNNDIVGRMLAEHLSHAWSVPVVVDNRPGAGGNVGNELVAKAASDGYTLLNASPALVTSPALYSSLSYDPTKDFAPIAITVLVPQVLVVNMAVPVKTAKELVELARAKPGTLNYGSAGVGSGPHVAGALLAKMANVDIVHIPYKGTTLALNDLLGGRLHMQFGGVLALLPHIRSGKVRALAISTAQRSQALPELPTVAESNVPGYDNAGWLGLAAPAGTPRAIVNALSAQVARFGELPETRKRLDALGGEPVVSSPDQFNAFIRREVMQWKKVLSNAG